MAGMVGMGTMTVKNSVVGAASSASRSRPIIVFDIVETIIDPSCLAPLFARLFGNAFAVRAWLDNLFIYSQSITITGRYADSGAVGAAVLRMMANSRGIDIAPADMGTFKQASATMPVYPDVAPALDELRRSGYRLVTLSNSPNAASEAQLRHAGIRDHFERLFSIDDKVRRYKPSPEAYLSVAEALGVAPSDLWLVSCHAFDVLGARSAGLHAVFLSRPQNGLFDIGPQADVSVQNLSTLKDALEGNGPSWGRVTYNYSI